MSRTGNACSRDRLQFVSSTLTPSNRYSVIKHPRIKQIRSLGRSAVSQNRPSQRLATVCLFFSFSQTISINPLSCAVAHRGGCATFNSAIKRELSSKFDFFATVGISENERRFRDRRRKKRVTQVYSRCVLGAASYLRISLFSSRVYPPMLHLRQRGVTLV